MQGRETWAERRKNIVPQSGIAQKSKSARRCALSAVAGPCTAEKGPEVTGNRKMAKTEIIVTNNTQVAA